MSKKKTQPKRVVKKPKRRKSLAAQPYDLDRDGVTQSLLASFAACRQRAALSLRGWRPVRVKSSLNFGSMFHGLLEMLYNAIRIGGIGYGDRDDVRGLFNDFMDQYVARQFPRGRAVDPDELRDTRFCEAQAWPVFEAYCWYHKKDFKPERWIELEGTFDVKWRGVRLRGRRDGMEIVKRSLGLLETKTKSQIDQGALDDALIINFQNLFYITAANEELRQAGSKQRVSRVLYNIVRRPGLQRGGRDGADEPLPKYSLRIAEHIKKKGPSYYFVRYPLTYPKQELERFEVGLGHLLDEFRAWVNGDLPTYANGMAGGACFTRWKCGFLQACASGGEDGPMSDYHRKGRLFNELED